MPKSLRYLIVAGIYLLVIYFLIMGAMAVVGIIAATGPFGFIGFMALGYWIKWLFKTKKEKKAKRVDGNTPTSELKG